MGAVPTIEEGVLTAVLYSDVFDYAMNADEIHRYVVGVECSLEEVAESLDSSPVLRQRLTREGDLFFLNGREHLVPIRAEVDCVSASHWEKTRYYGGYLRSIPGIQMALVTGSLAANNNRSHADVDLMCTMDDRRIWSTWLALRWMTRLGNRFKADPHFCLNYIIASNKKTFPQSFYIAWELVKAVPLFGGDIYQEILRNNDWIYGFLPNAEKRVSPDMNVESVRDVYSHSTRAVVGALHSPMGRVVEKFEERREKAAALRAEKKKKVPKNLPRKTRRNSGSF